MPDNPDFLPGIGSYGEFRSRLDDAEDAERISKRKSIFESDDDESDEIDDDENDSESDED